MTMNRKDLQDQMIREIEFTCPEVLYTQVGRRNQLAEWHKSG